MHKAARRLAVLVGLTCSLTAGALLPDPSPGGPQRPYEPDVDGPRNVDTLEVTPTALGPASRDGYRPVALGFDRRSQSDDGGAPAGARRFVFLFDRSIRFRHDAFPTCARSVVERSGVDACPSDSRVGSGLAGFYPDGHADVFVLNTRLADNRRGVLVVIPETGTVLEQTLEPVSLSYRWGYRWALDEIIPPDSRPPEERPGTVRFQLEFAATTTVSLAGDDPLHPRSHLRREPPHPASEPAHDRVVGFAETRADIGDPLDFGLWSEFVTGQRVLPEETTAPR